MVRLNPAQRVRKYGSVPKGAVTAFFAAGQDYDDAIQALMDDGFLEEQIDVFAGETGAESLDMEGRHHGRFMRFVHGLEDALTDDAYLYHRTDAVLREGGTVIAVFTHGDLEDRTRTVEILKNNGGVEPIYWGKWVTETF